MQLPARLGNLRPWKIPVRLKEGLHLIKRVVPEWDGTQNGLLTRKVTVDDNEDFVLTCTFIFDPDTHNYIYGNQTNWGSRLSVFGPGNGSIRLLSGNYDFPEGTFVPHKVNTLVFKREGGRLFFQGQDITDLYGSGRTEGLSIDAFGRNSSATVYLKGCILDFKLERPSETGEMQTAAHYPMSLHNTDYQPNIAALGGSLLLEGFDSFVPESAAETTEMSDGSFRVTRTSPGGGSAVMALHNLTPGQAYKIRVRRADGLSGENSLAVGNPSVPQWNYYTGWVPSFEGVSEFVVVPETSSIHVYLRSGSAIGDSSVYSSITISEWEGCILQNMVHGEEGNWLYLEKRWEWSYWLGKNLADQTEAKLPNEYITNGYLYWDIAPNIPNRLVTLGAIISGEAVKHAAYGWSTQNAVPANNLFRFTGGKFSGTRFIGGDIISSHTNNFRLFMPGTDYGTVQYSGIYVRQKWEIV